MRKIGLKLMAILVGILFFMNIGAANDPSSSVVGLWQTIDDHLHQATGIVQMWQSGGKYFGKIVKIYPVNGAKPDDLCTHCTGDLQNKPVLKMVVINNMVQSNGGVYNGGTILDPKTGKIYRCQMTLMDNGTHLQVRGYIGTPILGRTQIWKRVDNTQI